MYHPKLLYLLILACSLLFPFLLSFVKGVSYYKNWKYLLISHTCIAILFCIWDMLFTRAGIWSFNPTYIIGVYIYNLPIEEVLFFLVIPYCCLFIYESIKFHYNLKWNLSYYYLIIGLITGVISIYNYNLLYTSISFGLCAILCAYLYKRNNSWLSNFSIAFIISLIPFLLVNGILTGGITMEPIVIYNNSQNLAIRIGSIPIEDLFYGFDLLVLNVILYEFLKNRKSTITSH